MFNRRLSVPLPWVILIFALLLFIPLFYFSIKLTTKNFFDDEGPFWLFMVGLVPGLAVALLQFLLSWSEFSQISKFSKMKIKGVLDSRDSATYYSSLLLNAQTQIDVQGVTATRFMRDFSDGASQRLEKRSLLTALGRGVKVRFLLPEKNQLLANQHADFDYTHHALAELRLQFPQGIHVRYFSSPPTTSLVRVDDDIIAGPVFQNMQSQHTPAIHTVVGSRFGQTYLGSLDAVWAGAREI